jgi:hypothetical protein
MRQRPPDYEYVALVPISHGGLLAYNPGDRVHGDNVQANGYKIGEQVSLWDSPQAQEVAERIAASIVLPAAAPEEEDEPADQGDAKVPAVVVPTPVVPADGQPATDDPARTPRAKKT